MWTVYTVLIWLCPILGLLFSPGNSCLVRPQPRTEVLDFEQFFLQSLEFGSYFLRDIQKTEQMSSKIDSKAQNGHTGREPPYPCSTTLPPACSSLKQD